MHYIILRVFNDFNFNSNFYQMSQDKSKKVIDLFGDIISKLTTKWVVLYYIGNNAPDTKVYCCPFRKLSIVNGGLRIEFENKKTELKHENREFDAKLYGLLVRKGVIKKGDYIPNMVFLDENDRNELNKSLNKTKIIKNDKTIEELMRKNDWESLYNLLGSIEEIKGKKEWNNPEYLSAIAFAAGQLGKLGRIDKEVLKDSERRKEALEKLEVYRKNAETLYKRCIEIDKDNEVRYLDALAYIKYQYLLDCLNFRVEKPDVVKKNFYETGCLCKEVLKMQGDRIKTLYRIGYLYVDRCEMVFFKDNVSKMKYQNEGEKYLLNVINLYEQLKDEGEKKRCRNEYLKSYYTLGSYYADKSKFSFKKFKSVVLNKNFTLDNIYYSDLQRALEYLSKCFELQYGQGVDSIFEEAFIYKVKNTYNNWTNEPAEVLYWLGVTYMGIYTYIRHDKTIKDIQQTFIKRAKTCFEYALKLNWKEPNKRTPKDYIDEKLARLYILTGEYDKAIKQLEKYERRKGAPEYIINTYLFAKGLADNIQTA
ncbi:hypothetical protein [Thermobrachium celere]|uniref:hypothetical protein n=1 Tax=Thermobrachium celere TaxID=53422 RepID=UPI0019421EDC|nr:hypothetical protein [Thermobrachium celere]GFR36223.1 hypothetical protein TCEA9_20350 [Thermobrachium celere]